VRPGRELDALVAEKVIGLKPFQKRWVQGIHSGYVQAWLDSDDKEIYPYTLPEYSTSIDAAWEVVERIGGDFVLHRKTAWECIFFLGRGKYFQDRADTAPHSICLAALKAVGAL
jgi:hypothetical protein